jgi:hypothetical protein
MSVENEGPHYEGMDLESALKEAGHYDEVPNYERGCKFLDSGSTYLRADVPAFGSADGEIPTFVEFSRPIPYREGHFRTFKRINGTEFLLDATQHVNESPENEAVAHRERVRDDGGPTVELPEGEVLDYLKRVESDDDLPDFRGSPFLPAMTAMDLLMWVGKSHYPDPEAFVSEAKTQGVNKKIPTSGNQEPPMIRPFRTRLFVIHPRAIPTGRDASGEEIEIDNDDDDKADWDDQEFIPGIVGYTYLTRAIHTADPDGGHPEWAREYEQRGLLNRVTIGDMVTKDDPAHPDHESDDAGDDESGEGDGMGLSEYARRRDAWENVGLSFQLLRREASKHGLDVGQNPTKDDLLDALASDPDVPVPEVRDGDDA